MKRKIPAQEPLKAAAAPAETVQGAAFRPWDVVQVSLFAALLFLAMTVQTGRMSVVLPVLALALSVGREPLRRLRERFCVPTVAFIAFAAVYGAAAIYASFGGYAVRELYKMTASVSLSVIALTRFDRRHVRGLMWGAAAVCAVISLVSMDAALDGPLFKGFSAFVEAFGGSAEGASHNAWGSRVNGIYNDANITAGILALGCFCGLHLTMTGSRRRERLAACVLTGFSGMGFFLAMSRGAILCFGLALLVYLAAAGGRDRLRLFILIALNALVTMGLSLPASLTVFSGTPVPLLLSALCGLAVWALYEYPGLWLSERLVGQGFAVAVIIAGIALAAGVYFVAATQVTGKYTFGDERLLARIEELSPGEYTVTTYVNGGLTVLVWSSDGEGGWNQIAGEEGAAEASFTVETQGEILFQFWGEPGTVLERASLSDGTQIPLGYPLLPRFAAERLQNNLWEDTSFTERIQYDRDGWKIFSRSPLLGWGPGSTEGLLTSVQPVYYETLYVHNHVLQILCDCGLLGAIPFLAFLLGSLWLLLRRLRETWREGGDLLAAALLGCWVMANVHGLMELNFSIRAYQCEAFLILLLPVILYGKPLVKEKALRVCGIVLNAALCVYLGVFAFGLERHRTAERQAAGFSTGSAEAFMEQTRKWIEMDWFDKEQNQLNFVGNAVLLEDPQYEEDALRYVKALRDSGTYTACTGLAEYYYLPRGELAEVFAASREAIAQEASGAAAWNQQLDFYRQTVLPSVDGDSAADFLDGVLALGEYLEEYNRGRREQIRLTQENQAFLDQAVQAGEAGLEGQALLLYFMIPGVTAG